MKFSRIVEVNKKAFTAYFLSPAGADVGKISISCTGKIITSEKPVQMSLATWLLQVIKAVKLAGSVFTYQISENDD